MNVTPVANIVNTPNQQKHTAVEDASIGLVLPAINGHFFQLEADRIHAQVQIFADFTEVRVINTEYPSEKPGKPAKRGAVTTFSRKSRTRMMREVAKIRNLDAKWFVTLTYPGKFEYDPAAVKRHLFAIKKRLFRKFPDLGLIWRLELKIRKTGASTGETVPHLHLIPLNLGYVPFDDMKTWIARSWNKVVKGDGDHLISGTRVELIKDRKHAMLYVSKYVAKVEETDRPEEEPQFYGRYWGIAGKVDRTPMVQATIDIEQFKTLLKNVAWDIRQKEWQKTLYRASKINEKPIPLSEFYKEPAKRQMPYSERLYQLFEKRGFGVLGYGDQSNGNQNWKISKIWRLITVSCRDKNMSHPLDFM